MKKSAINFKIDDDLKKKLKLFAIKNGVTMQWHIERLLRRSLKKVKV